MTEREVLWTPSPERVAAATLTRYQRWLREERGVDTGSYEELWDWSVSNLEDFWGSIAEFFEVRFSSEPSAVLGSRRMPGAEWFPGARVNYAEHVFRGRQAEQVAIEHVSEIRPLASWTWQSWHRRQLRSPRAAGPRRGAR